MTRAPWDDRESVQQQRKREEREREERYLDSCQSVCENCGQMLWKGQHIEGCPEEDDDG